MRAQTNSNAPGERPQDNIAVSSSDNRNVKIIYIKLSIRYFCIFKSSYLILCNIATASFLLFCRLRLLSNKECAIFLPFQCMASGTVFI